jgi:hypothetical protein
LTNPQLFGGDPLLAFIFRETAKKKVSTEEKLMALIQAGKIAEAVHPLMPASRDSFLAACATCVVQE